MKKSLLIKKDFGEKVFMVTIITTVMIYFSGGCMIFIWGVVVRLRDFCV